MSEQGGDGAVVACPSDVFVWLWMLDEDTPPAIYACCEAELGKDCGWIVEHSADIHDWSISSTQMAEYVRLHAAHTAPAPTPPGASA